MDNYRDKILKGHIMERARTKAIIDLEKGKYDDKPFNTNNMTYLRLTNKAYYNSAYRYYWNKHFLEHLNKVLHRKNRKCKTYKHT